MKVSSSRPIERAVLQRITKLRSLLVLWGPIAGRLYPWRSTEDPFHRILAEMLLQRTRADAVMGAWPTITGRFASAADLATASEFEIAEQIRTLGLAKKRSKYLKGLGIALERHGKVPDRFDVLVSLPGVGAYSAGAFLATWLKHRTSPVDANVRRVLGRVAIGVDASGEKQTVPLMKKLMSREDPAIVLLALLDFGASPCRPRRPLCEECPARKFCVTGIRARGRAGSTGGSNAARAARHTIVR